jgi:hypothetical protein
MKTNEEIIKEAIDNWGNNIQQAAKNRKKNMFDCVRKQFPDSKFVEDPDVFELAGYRFRAIPDLGSDPLTITFREIGRGYELQTMDHFAQIAFNDQLEMERRRERNMSKAVDTKPPTFFQKLKHFFFDD